MLRKTSRTDAVKDKAADLLSSATEGAHDAAETVKDAIAPVARTLAEKVEEAAGTASDAAAPQVDKAKKAAAPKLKDAKDAAAPKVADVKKAAAPKLKQAKKAAAPKVEQIRESAAPYVAQAQEAGVSREQVQGIFEQEWSRVQQAIAAATHSAALAGQQAYAALPTQAQHSAEAVVPSLKKKRKKKGKLLIALGLLAGAGAVALIVSGKQQDKKAAQPVTTPEVERLKPADLATGDDLVGDSEARADAVLTGGEGTGSTAAGESRGKHAARD